MIPERPPATLFECLRAQAQRAPHAWALLAPGRRPLTYAGLLAQVQHTVAQLLVFGVGRGDRVAVVVENGPEQATAILGTAVAAACAPLNPAFSAAEFTHYLARLGARALIAHEHPVAVEAARALGIAVLTLAPTRSAPAGSFTLQGALKPLHGPGGSAQPEDTALLVHTAGATGQPKLVPLTQRHLVLSALNILPRLGLTPADRCLSLLPFFSPHGLNAGLLASLAAGASVVCAPGLEPGRVAGWLREFQPTWYSASPALLAGLLEAVAADPAAVRAGSLRFVRASGAPLPAPLARALEQGFRVPVLESYGLAEANPVACNPLPPRARKPGSVGLACGPEIGIMAPQSAVLLPVGQTGEVVVRGPSVITGYAGDALANVQRFTDGWLRTGDLGYLDHDGYLFLTGRLTALGQDSAAPMGHLSGITTNVV